MSVPEHVLDPEATDEPPRSSSPRSLRPLILRLHFYAGVLVAPFILVAAITGALYALAPTIERVVYADILSVDPGSDPLPLDEQAASARAAFPQLQMSGIRPAAGDTDSSRVYFVDPGLGEEKLRAVFVDPYTGRVLGDEATWLGQLPLSTWLDGLHRHLNLGEPGRVYSELAASWLWVVALGGLYLWSVKAAADRRRGRRARVLTVDRGATGRSRTMNRHGAVGVWVLVMLLFLSATGITWSTYAGAHVSDIRAALNWQRPELDTALGEPRTVDPAAIDYDGVVTAANLVGVGAPLEVTVPAGGGVGVTEIDKPYRLTTNAASVDPATLSVTGGLRYWRDYSVVAKLADWGIRMHMGVLFGWVNQILLFGVAVAAVTAIVLGYRMWWQRRPTRGSAWVAGRPPMRGAIRRLHPAAALAVVMVAGAVGWFLPLLGISLVAFLVLDLLVAAVAARRLRTG